MARVPTGLLLVVCLLVLCDFVEPRRYQCEDSSHKNPKAFEWAEEFSEYCPPEGWVEEYGDISGILEMRSTLDDFRIKRDAMVSEAEAKSFLNTRLFGLFRTGMESECCEESCKVHEVYEIFCD